MEVVSNTRPLILILYCAGILLPYRAGLIASHAPLRETGVRAAAYLRRAPATVLLLLLITIPTLCQLADSRLLPLLRRDRAAILDGQWWRLITSLCVQDSVTSAVFNLITLAMIGTVAERLWRTAQVVALFMIGGIAGELAGMVWRPLGAGNSVGTFGLAAGVAVALAISPATGSAKLLAYGALTVDVLLLLCQDLHGAAAIAAAIAALLLRQARETTRSTT